MPDSLHLVDAAIRPLIDQFAAFDRSLPLTEQRARVLKMLGSSMVSPVGFRRSEHLVSRLQGGPAIRVLIYVPEKSGASYPALLHIHGGGFTKGAPEMADARNASLAAEHGCVVVSVDYRLAPEAPYPAAIEDCYAALVWAYGEAEALQIDRARIGVVGESAGGGHAASLALLARDRGEVPLAFQWLFCPMIDDRTGAVGEAHPYAGEFVWTPQMNRESWLAMLGCTPGGPLPGPYAAAARAADLSGLPPTLIQAAALDLFIEENLDYARRLIHAGVPTELHVYPGAIHGFTLMRDSPLAQTSERDGIYALQRAMKMNGSSSE